MLPLPISLTPKNRLARLSADERIVLLNAGRVQLTGPRWSVLPRMRIGCQLSRCGSGWCIITGGEALIRGDGSEGAAGNKAFGKRALWASSPASRHQVTRKALLLS
jgi:hypothetical protein